MVDNSMKTSSQGLLKSKQSARN